MRLSIDSARTLVHTVTCIYRTKIPLLSITKSPLLIISQSSGTMNLLLTFILLLERTKNNFSGQDIVNAKSLHGKRSTRKEPVREQHSLDQWTVSLVGLVTGENG